MSDFRIDQGTGDIIIEGESGLQLVSDKAEAVAQRLYLRLSIGKGEYFANENFGVPYMQDIFVKSATKDVADTILKQVISNTPGVQAISLYFSKVDTVNRDYSATFTVKTVEGEEVTLTV